MNPTQSPARKYLKDALLLGTAVCSMLLLHAQAVVLGLAASVISAPMSSKIHLTALQVYTVCLNHAPSEMCFNLM